MLAIDSDKLPLATCDFRSLKVDSIEYGKPVLALKMTKHAPSDMSRSTPSNLDRLMAIVVDGEVITYARIRSAIYASEILEGNFRKDEISRINETLGEALYFETDSSPSYCKYSLPSNIFKRLNGRTTTTVVQKTHRKPNLNRINDQLGSLKTLGSKVGDQSGITDEKKFRINPSFSNNESTANAIKSAIDNEKE